MMKTGLRSRGCVFAAAAVMVGVMYGCSGGAEGLYSEPPPQVTPPPFAATFSAIQDSVFATRCTSCHSGVGAPEGLSLDAASSYAMLVGVASTQDNTILRVAAGNPGASYLIRKLEGTTATGARMPPSGPALAQAEIDVVRQWVTDGAMDDRPPAAGPVRITSVSPLPGTTLDTAPTQIMAMFDRELDVSTVNPTTFLLDRSGNDGSFVEGNEIPVTAGSITAPGSNPMSAVFDLTSVTLVDDTYRVRLLGSGGSMILDLGANALDGEYLGAFPSGNGLQGGDFSATFMLSTPVPLGPTLDAIQANVFTPLCSGCHTGPTSTVLPAGLDLSDADASHLSLVGMPSIEDMMVSRVVVGDPVNSYLMHKLEGTASSGSIMPPSGVLDPAVIAAVRQWIMDGAMR